MIAMDPNVYGIRQPLLFHWWTALRGAFVYSGIGCSFVSSITLCEWMQAARTRDAWRPLLHLVSNSSMLRARL